MTNQQYHAATKTDPLATLLKSPDIIARIAAFVLAIMVLLTPAFGVHPEVYDAYRKDSALALLPGSRSVMGMVSDPVGIALLVFTAMIALGILLKLIPAVAHYARLADLVAVVCGGIGTVAVLGLMFERAQLHGNLPAGGYMSSARRMVDNAISPGMGTWALSISVLIMLAVLVLPYVLGRRAAA